MNSECFLIDTNIFVLLFNDRLTEPLPHGEKEEAIRLRRESGLKLPDAIIAASHVSPCRSGYERQ